VFSGEYEHVLDDKGRIFLPARYRDEMGEMVVLSRGVDGQVNAYPLEAWRKIAEQVAQRNQAVHANRDMNRLLFAVSECPIDKQGRLLIPPSLRRHAALDSEVVIVGVNDHLEVWSQQRWQEVTDRLRAEGSAIADELAQLGLVM
jgi:MraZ protein